MKVINTNFFTWLKINFRTTFLLLSLNVILGILTYLLAFLLFRGSDSLALVFLGAQILPGTEAPLSAFVLEYYRFLTSAFLHGGLLHLLFNMYALYAVGGYVERYYGGKKLFTAYVLTAIAGSMLSFAGAFLELWMNKGVATGVGISVGASGAIFGLIGMILGNKFLKRRNFGPDLNIDTKNLLWIVVINLFFGFSVNLLGTGVLVNNWAHVGGLLSGMVLGAFFDTSNTYGEGGFKKAVETFLFILSVVLFIMAWGFNLVSMWTLFNSL